jgi:hypothetical protein
MEKNRKTLFSRILARYDDFFDFQKKNETKKEEKE